MRSCTGFGKRPEWREQHRHTRLPRPSTPVALAALVAAVVGNHTALAAVVAAADSMPEVALFAAKPVHTSAAAAVVVVARFDCSCCTPSLCQRGLLGMGWR